MPHDNQWAILDTETDGLYPPIHAVEVAAQRMIGSEPVGAPFHVFINHDVHIPPEAVAIHGYTRDFLAAHGDKPHSAHSQLRDFICDRPIAAHYLRFDWDMTLQPEWTRLGIAQIGTRGLCTWGLARRVIDETPSHRLDTLRTHFALQGASPHSALGDVQATTDLLRRVILPRLARIGINTYDQVAEFATARPLARCLCLVQGRDYERALQERRRNADLLEKLDWNEIDNLPRLIVDENLIVDEPEIHFRGKVFLFTGKLKWGSRTKAQSVVQRLGGLLAKSKSVSDEVDYLVLGEDDDKGWTTLINGGKLQQAFRKKLTMPKGRLNMILEAQFIAAVNSTFHDRG